MLSYLTWNKSFFLHKANDVTYLTVSRISHVKRCNRVQNRIHDCGARTDNQSGKWSEQLILKLGPVPSRLIATYFVFYTINKTLSRISVLVLRYNRNTVCEINISLCLLYINLIAKFILCIGKMPKFTIRYWFTFL